MSEALWLVLATVTGVGLGMVFFGGLWWTLKKGLSSRRPALWFTGSLLVRMALALAGFYLVSDGHWQRLLLCLSGFLVARVVTTWLTRPPVDSGARMAHALPQDPGVTREPHT